MALNSEQTSNDVSIDGINTDAPVSVTGGEYSIDGGAFTSADGTIAPGGQVRVRVIASSQFSTGATVTLNVGGVEGSFVVTTLAADTTPDAFTFGSINDIPLNSVQTSNEATITGLNTDAPVSVSGGEYSIDGGSWTSAAGTIAADAAVRVRVTAAGMFSTPATATLDIGGVTADFTVTTLAAVTDPNAFSFGSVSDVPLNSVQTSGAVTITGINTGSPVSVVGGEYSIDNGPFTAADGLINPGQMIAVRTTASGDFSTAVTVIVTIGTVTGTYTVTTLSEDLTPDNFSFSGVTGVNPSTEQTSDPVTITGINSAAPVLVTGGSYSIDGGAFTSAPGTITSGQQLRARTNASPDYDTTVQAQIDVGGVSAGFSVTTRSADGAPDPFAFAPVTNAQLGRTYTSNSVTISGIDLPVAITIGGGNGSYSINGGAFTRAAGTVQAGDTVRAQVQAATSYGETRQVVVTVGNGAQAQSAMFRVSTADDDLSPNYLNFGSVADAPLGSTQTSRRVTISGITTAVPISISGGRYSIDGGEFTTGAGTISEGQTVVVEAIAASTYATTVTVQVTVGAARGEFTVTTLAEDANPDVLDFDVVPDALPGSVQTSVTLIVSGINVPTAIRVSGGEYAIGDGEFTHADGEIAPGETLTLRGIASMQFGATQTVTLTIGTITAHFTIVTAAADTDPDSFVLGTISGADPDSEQRSGVITIRGINTAAPVTISGGRYSINGGAFTSAPGTVEAGEEIVVAVTAASTSDTTVTATLSIGAVNAQFAVSTSTVLPPVEVEGRRGGGAMGPGWLLSLAALAFWRRRRPAGVLRRSGDAMR
ncbi:hypothetical protein E4T66_13535 [Sinimarinibacterium sp. CAU 1509]|nr:hypothetical protein E4T66_13535 [Sinimarinibacterium sp. CAU 1509]